MYTVKSVWLFPKMVLPASSGKKGRNKATKAKKLTITEIAIGFRYFFILYFIMYGSWNVPSFWYN